MNFDICFPKFTQDLLKPKEIGDALMVKFGKYPGKFLRNSRR